MKEYFLLECQYDNCCLMGKFFGFKFYPDGKIEADLATDITHALRFKTKEQAEEFQKSFNEVRKTSTCYLHGFDLKYVVTAHLDE